MVRPVWATDDGQTFETEIEAVKWESTAHKRAQIIALIRNAVVTAGGAPEQRTLSRAAIEIQEVLEGKKEVKQVNYSGEETPIESPVVEESRLI